MDKLTPSQAERFREHFALFDRDGNGKISEKEIGTALRSLGYTPDEKELNQIKDDVNGDIEFEEFVNLVVKRMSEPLTTEELRDALSIFDKNEDGYITADELHSQLTALGDKLSIEEAQAFIADADPESSGKLRLEDLANMLSGN